MPGKKVYKLDNDWSVEVLQKIEYYAITLTSGTLGVDRPRGFFNKRLVHNSCTKWPGPGIGGHNICSILYMEDIPWEQRMRAMPCGTPIPQGIVEAFVTYSAFHEVL